MNIETLKKKLCKKIKEEGLRIVVTRQSSRDFWQMGRYAIVDERNCLLKPDIDLWEEAEQLGLLQPEETFAPL